MTDTESAPFTFVQLNMWDGRLCYPLYNFFDRVKPDILSAQEVLSGPKDISPSYLTAETILKKGYFDHIARGFPSLEEEVVIKNIPYAEYCMTFAKNPIMLHESKVIHLDPDRITAEANRPRSEYYDLLHTVLELPGGQSVHVLNHHGVLVYEGRMGHKPGDHNFKRIAEYIETLSGPVILSGDFNMYKESSSLKPLHALGLKNLNDVHGITKARNEFSWKPDEAVSHLFINDKVIVEDYHVAQDNVSDHLPLVMRCRVRP